MSATSTDYQLISRVEQFYYREARLLDERCLQQWLGLVDEAMEYSMPSRFVPQPDPKLQDTEAFLSVDRELDRDASPLRSDGAMGTFARTFRGYKMNGWSESPPPRTRRMISNVEVVALDDDRYETYSNFNMFYSNSSIRNGADNHMFTGRRRDVLKDVDGDFKIVKREVVLDMDLITVPTVALIF